MIFFYVVGRQKPWKVRILRNSNNHDSASKKQWNKVVTSLDDKDVQRGLIHQLKKRSHELTEAVCRWPDLLLKAAQSALGTKANDQFCNFLASLPGECLLRSFGGYGLAEQYSGLRQKVALSFAAYATPEALETLLFGDKISEEISEIIASWAICPHFYSPEEDYWQRLFREANNGNDHSQKAVIHFIASQIAFGKMPMPIHFQVLPSFKEETRSCDDPRIRMKFRAVPWVMAAEETTRNAAARMKRIFEKLELPERFSRLVISTAEQEEKLLSTLREKWPRLNEEAKRWVPGFGLTKITPDFWGLDLRDVGVIEITVDPAGREFPALGVDLRCYAYFHEFTDHFEVGVDGVPDLSCWEKWQQSYRLAIWEVVARRLFDFATAPESKVREQIGTTSRQNTGKKRPVPPRFVRLPNGYKASAAAIERAIENRGYAPPPGKTFRMSPPIHERQTPENYKHLVLVAKAPKVD